MPDDEIEEGPEHCTHCGREILGEFDFCPYCGRGLRVMKIPQTSFRPSSEKKCQKCSATIDVNFQYCPYCGHEQGSSLRQQEPVMSWRMIILYILSFLVPPIGVVIWMFWKKDPEGETRNEGEYCLGSAFLGLVAYVLILSIYL